jgi:hypothetical protein
VLAHQNINRGFQLESIHSFITSVKSKNCTNVSTE